MSETGHVAAPILPASLKRRLSAGRELALAAVLVAVALGAFVAERLIEAQRDMGDQRDRTLVIEAERLLSAAKDVETGQRGFLLTGDPAYLQPYTAALPQVQAHLNALSALGVALDGLPEAVKERIDSAEAGMAARRAGGIAAAVDSISQGRGRLLMDTVRAKVAGLQAAAVSRTDRRQRRVNHETPWVYALGLLALAGAIAMVAVYSVRRRRDSRAAGALLQDVLQNAPVGLGLLDRSLRIRHMNRALVAMSGRALGVEVGSSIWDVMPELQETFAGKLQRVLDGGRPIPNTEIEAADPARPNHVRQFLVSFYPVGQGGTSSENVGAGMVVTDVTVRNRLERRVRESEERFRTLTESSASIIWTTSPTGEYIHEQRQWMAFTGQEWAAASGMGWLDAVEPEDREATIQAWTRAVSSGEPYAVEHRLRRADGAWRYMAVQGVAVREEDGTIREWVGTHSDITERRLAETALAAAKDAAESANRAKSVFLANMSHELRTPLSAVIGYSEMLEEEMEDLGEPHLIADLQKIKTNARHLLSLINDVLDLSKIEANRMTSYAEDFEVATVAREAVATVDALVQRKENTMVLQLDDGLGTMHTDVVKLRQCLFNLISNAAKFTEKGQISLSVHRNEDWVEFVIADTGIGMSEEQLGRLFQRFSQADESTTRNFGGTGLGLALTRAFCRLLGGEVLVESKLGEGTTFTIRLPAIMPEQAPAEAINAPDEAKRQDQQLVLVVDDDASQRDLLSRFLTREGFAVATAADGRAGLEMARALRPRAILLDVMMPQMDGWSVLTALKAEPALAAIPVIMASFVNEPALASALGAVDYVLKPVEWDHLKAIMKRFRANEGAVLVVDDDPDARSRLRTVLERDDWSVTEASNGQEALASVDQATPQAILLDLTMPVMDGFSFLEALRQRPGGADIPVIVLSARDLTQGDRQRLSSADKVLRKGDMDLRDLPEQLAELRHSHP
jgi:PAS domain S-box-containing protein